MKIDRARLFDLRVVQRNIRSGRVNKDEYAAYLSGLGDTSPKIKPREEGGDEDGYDGHPEPAIAYEPERSVAPQIASLGGGPDLIAPSVASMPPSMPSPAAYEASSADDDAELDSED